MNIGHFQSSYFPRLGGVPASTRNFCMCMPHHRHNIFVRDLYRAGKSIDRAPVGREDLGYAVVERFYQPLDNTHRLYTPELVQAIKDSDIDVLIVHRYKTYYDDLIINCGKPVIVRVSNLDQPVSDRVKSYVKEIVSYTPCPVYTKVILPFIDYDIFKDYEEGDNSLVYTGRIAGEKGLERLLPILGGWKLRIIGEADHPSDYENFMALVKKYNADVEILTPIFHDLEKYAKLICRSRYYVLPSPREMLCNSLLEALSCNRVCLVMNTKGVSWADGYFHNIDSLDDIEHLERKETHSWIREMYCLERLQSDWDKLLLDIYEKNT